MKRCFFFKIFSSSEGFLELGAAVKERVPTSAREAAALLAAGRRPGLAPAALAAQQARGATASQAADVPGWLNQHGALNGTRDNWKQPPLSPNPGSSARFASLAI